MTIKSDRLDFIPLNTSHLPHLFALDSIPEVMQFIQTLTPTLEDAEKKLARYLNYGATHPGLGGFALFKKGTKDFMGFGFLVDVELNDTHGKVEVGYRLHPQHWGQGYASEVAKTLLDYGFGTLGLQEIYGTTEPTHVVSQAVLKKMGMNYVGEGPYHTGCSIFVIKKPK